MKIGFIQSQPFLGNLKQTMRHLEPLLAATNEANLVVLPELANSGYNFKSKKMAWETSETIGDSQFIDFLKTIAKKNNQFIVSGFNERLENQLFNTAILVGPDGYIGKYQKLHLYKNEKEYFQVGNTGLPIFDIGFCKIGLLICYDFWFPEVWRILSLKGTDIICHPSNLVMQGFGQRVANLHARLNKVFVMTTNRIGSEGKLTFTGLSSISSPKGRVLIQAPQNETHTAVIDIDIQQAKNKMVSPKNHLFEDRRIDVYGELLDDFSPVNVF